jgi:hypothetical protein
MNAIQALLGFILCILLISAGGAMIVGNFTREGSLETAKRFVSWELRVMGKVVGTLLNLAIDITANILRDLVKTINPAKPKKKGKKES